MKAFAWLSAVLVLGLAAGCASISQKIVGEWGVKIPDDVKAQWALYPDKGERMMEQAANTRLLIKAGGKFETRQADKVGKLETLRGTYRISGLKVILQSEAKDVESIEMLYDPDKDTLTGLKGQEGEVVFVRVAAGKAE